MITEIIVNHGSAVPYLQRYVPRRGKQAQCAAVNHGSAVPYLQRGSHRGAMDPDPTVVNHGSAVPYLQLVNVHHGATQGIAVNHGSAVPYLQPPARPSHRCRA